MLPTGQWDYNAAVTYSSKSGGSDNSNNNAANVNANVNGCNGSEAANHYHNSQHLNAVSGGWSDSSAYTHNSMTPASAATLPKTTTTTSNNHTAAQAPSAPLQQTPPPAFTNGIEATVQQHSTVSTINNNLNHNGHNNHNLVNNAIRTTTVPNHNNVNAHVKEENGAPSFEDCRVRKPAMILASRPRAATFANVPTSSSDVSGIHLPRILIRYYYYYPPPALLSSFALWCRKYFDTLVPDNLITITEEPIVTMMIFSYTILPSFPSSHSSSFAFQFCFCLCFYRSLSNLLHSPSLECSLLLSCSFIVIYYGSFYLFLSTELHTLAFSFPDKLHLISYYATPTLLSLCLTKKYYL